jgi:hypothetical protein
MEQTQRVLQAFFLLSFYLYIYLFKIPLSNISIHVVTVHHWKRSAVGPMGR